MRSKVPKYVQIAEILKRRIANGNYMSQSFPGGPKLVAEFGVNYRTVRQAFQLLLDEGLLVRGENERLVQPGGAGRTPFKVAFVSSGYCCPADKWLLAVREAARKYRCMFCRVVFDTTDDAILYETLDGDFDLIFLSVGTPDGLLLDKIRQKKEKVVLLFADMSAEGIPFFDGIDNEACALIVRHLARRNCRKIDFFSVMQTPEFYTARRDVWEKTLKELNCTGEAYCVMGNVEEERFVQAHRLAAGFLKQGAFREADGVFCSDVEAAQGLLRAFADAGIRVPEEIQVASFGAPELAAMFIPSITVIRTPPLAPLAAELFEHFLGITPQPGRLRFNFDYRKFTEDELIMQGESTWKNEGGVP
ncbi:substrate-binding domain-containing protein [Victivallis vadensis]|uniref:Substrate-binding domain-containing protein n=1 Tax=Victivallis vadensis TaxID=172901 RepID=A0A848AZB1_9BACT|nr:substrate-binding domain-containing protein [Victivallis vadensis]NMD88241.1 substrate-binding domain-containing protein [Victivallis vadensis]